MVVVFSRLHRLYIDIPRRYFMPILWFDQRASLTPELVEEVSSMVTIYTISTSVAFSLLIVGMVMAALGITMACRRFQVAVPNKTQIPCPCGPSYISRNDVWDQSEDPDGSLSWERMSDCLWECNESEVSIRAKDVEMIWVVKKHHLGKWCGTIYIYVFKSSDEEKTWRMKLFRRLFFALSLWHPWMIIISHGDGLTKTLISGLKVFIRTLPLSTHLFCVNPFIKQTLTRVHWIYSKRIV